jgi:tRNA 2-selenouridine synthase
MAIEKKHIEQFLELAKKHPVIDVRSPGEYNHAHIPGAYSLPLFTDEERKVVGTTYKQKSREQAIKIGLDFFGLKMKLIVEKAEEIISNRQLATGNTLNTNGPLPVANCLLLYCWRGGMRSAAVAWLLDLYGFKVYTLAGGYKKFRNYVLESFNENHHLNILGGYTGSGKTEVLNNLIGSGEKFIDLEGIANHKGSAFGNIGMPKQPTQEMFENMLATRLNEVRSQKSEAGDALTSDIMPLTSGIWLEDESQRIGLVNIPNAFWKTMRHSQIYFLDIPFEERLRHITKEYGALDKQQMIEAINRIKEKLGEVNAKAAIQFLEEGNTEESFRILLKYYDKYYFKALHNREGLNSLLHTVECKSVTPENTKQLVLHLRNQYQTI